MKPIRLQRKRVKGFNLQEVSMKINGLPAVSCTRPHKWGNCFKVTGEEGNWFVSDNDEPLVTFNIKEEAIDCSLELYREGQAHDVNSGKLNLGEISGKNLACFCALDQKCHVDTLLELANS